MNISILKKISVILLIIITVTAIFISCDSSNSENTDTTAPQSGVNSENSSESSEENAVEETATMVFSGSTCNISDPSTVKVSGKIFTIIAPGIYRISGTLSDGQIRVEVDKTERVTLLLDNFNASCSDSGVIYVVSADKVYIDLEKGTANTLTDASVYVFEGAEDKPNACIYSSDDLTVKGGGTLTVNANYNNGIGCKNDVDIKNGVINVKAVNNAIKGNDSVTVYGDAVLNILGAEDGIKTENADEPEKGFITITEEAVVNITCSDDALQSAQAVTVTEGASVTIDCGGSPINCDGDQNIANGSVKVK